MTDSLREQVFGVMADVLAVPRADITDETSPATVEGWDSVQHLNLVLALEQQLGISLEPEEIEQMQSAGAIVKVLSEKSR